MPKIRDLGISVIPATMRPPEIGYGAAACHQTNQPPPPQCNGTQDQQCCPSEHESHRDKDKDKDRGGENISPDQRRELQQQLRQQIGLQV